MIHTEEHAQSGKVHRLKLKGPLMGVDGPITPEAAEELEYRVEDWWDRVGGGPWMHKDGNIACMNYGLHAGLADGIPTDNEVLYGKIGGLGYLIHVSELGEEVQVAV